ncbi:unnamed protein product [Prunus brigantina]
MWGFGTGGGLCVALSFESSHHQIIEGDFLLKFVSRLHLDYFDSGHRTKTLSVTTTTQKTGWSFGK